MAISYAQSAGQRGCRLIDDNLGKETGPLEVEVRLEIVAVVGSARTGLGFVQQRRTLPEISEPGPFPCFPLLASTFRRLFNETLSIGLQSAPYSSSATTAEGRCCRLAINCLASAWFGIWRRISSKIVSASAHFCWFAIVTASAYRISTPEAPSFIACPNAVSESLH